MSDNILPVQLAIFGFAEQPDIAGYLAGDGNGPIPIRQRCFDFRDGQFHPAGIFGLDFLSRAGSSTERKIRFITVVFACGTNARHYTDKLDACINGIDMDRIATLVAAAASADLAIRLKSMQDNFSKQRNSAIDNLAAAAVIVAVVSFVAVVAVAAVAVVAVWIIKIIMAMGKYIHDGLML